jgi:APA family basic amino acid/polyamine antiporter
MSKDGLLPKFFSEIHSKFHLSSKPICFHGICELFGFVPVSDLGHMVSIGTF